MALDGNASFPIAAAMASMYCFSGSPAVVVGVGYPAAPPEIQLLRLRDLTPPTPPEGIPRRPGIPPLGPEHYGGAAEFRGFLGEELRPIIAAAHKLDPSRQTLFGYSLGGLFALDNPVHPAAGLHPLHGRQPIDLVERQRGAQARGGLRPRHRGRDDRAAPIDLGRRPRAGGAEPTAPAA